MSRAEALAGRIRAALAGQQGPTPATQELARQWAELVQDAVERLDRAVSFSRKGLRTEAVAEAMAAPSVYETAALAAGEALSGWRDWCRRHHLPMPLLIDPALVAEMTECHAQLEPLRELLGRWRKLNVGRAGAPERLELLRQLRRQDPGNPTWEADLPALEHAAIADALAEFERCVALWDLERLWRLIRWMEQGPWSAAPGAAEAARLRERVVALSGRSAAERAAEVARRLHEEYMAESVDAATEQLREWEILQRFLADADVQLPPELLASVEPVLEWLRERQEASQRRIEHRTRVQELEALVEAPQVRLQELEGLASQVAAGPEPCPPALQGAVDRRIAELRRRRMALRALIVAACVAVIAGLAGAATWAVRRHERQARTEALLASVDASIRLGDLDGAQRTVDTAATDPATHPESVAAVRTRLAEARADAVKRDAAFAAALAALGDATAETAESVGAERLESVRALGRTAELRNQLSEWQRAAGDAAEERQRARDAAFTQELEAIDGRLATAAAAGDAEAAATLDEVQRMLRALEARERITPVVMARTRPIRFRADSLAAAIEDRRHLARQQAAEEADLARLPALAADADALATALVQFGRRHPASVHAAGFTKASMAAPAWRGALAWPAAADRLSSTLAGLDESGRDAARRRLQEHLDQFPASPYAASAARALGFVQRQGEWRAWLDSVLESAPQLRLSSVLLRNGQRFYYDERRPPQPGSDGVRVYQVVTGIKDPAKGEFLTEFLRVDPRQVVEDGESPQRVMARDLRSFLRQAPQDGVESAWEVLRRLRDAERVDAALRADLIASLLERLAPAVPPLQPEIAAARARLSGMKIEEIPWMDGRSLEARQRVQEISAALPRVVEAETWRNQWRTRAAQAATLLGQSLAPAGILLVDSNGPSVRLSGAARDGDLVCVEPAAQGGATEVVIGSMSADGSIRVDAQRAASLPSGTPVFRRAVTGSSP